MINDETLHFSVSGDNTDIRPIEKHCAAEVGSWAKIPMLNRFGLTEGMYLVEKIERVNWTSEDTIFVVLRVPEQYHYEINPEKEKWALAKLEKFHEMFELEFGFSLTSVLPMSEEGETLKENVIFASAGKRITDRFERQVIIESSEAEYFEKKEIVCPKHKLNVHELVA